MSISDIEHTHTLFHTYHMNTNKQVESEKSRKKEGKKNQSINLQRLRNILKFNSIHLNQNT